MRGKGQVRIQGARLVLPPRLEKASHAERERLWRGLERFARSGDSPEEYTALESEWPDFWPVEIRERGEFLLNWKPACHNLFLFYRDALRRLWSGGDALPYGASTIRLPEFLLGLGDANRKAREIAAGNEPESVFGEVPAPLIEAWQDILREYPLADAEPPIVPWVFWGEGSLALVPHNDFQRAFYLLLPQSWRARICRRCETFFIARKPKEVYCGSICRHAVQLELALDWWQRVGRKQRAARMRSRRRRRKKR